MGLKYIEQIKSVVLFVLVLLSITLTFSIWTYKPNYVTIEPTKVVDISIGKKRQIADVIKPYRMIFHKNEKWKGTNVNEEMQDILNEMKSWQVSDLTLVSNNLDAEKLDELVGMNNRMTLFFTGEIPFPVFQKLLPVLNKKIPEASFDRMIVDWSKMNSNDLNTNELLVFFANSQKNQLYKAKIKVNSEKGFQDNVLTVAKTFPNYVEIGREGMTNFYLPEKEINITKYTYLVQTDPVDRYRKALFSNPNIVKHSPDEATGNEKYTDDKALMTVDPQARTLNFVNISVVENKEMTVKSKLILNTFDFINEHGGWTGDFRYNAVEKQKVTYQLYLQDQPVFSDRTVTLTEISTQWGNGRISTYTRPYYKPVSLPEKGEGKLISGPEVIERLVNNKEIKYDDIDEIRSGYYLMKNDIPQLFTLEPMWFYSINGKWEHVSQSIVGGANIGLE
ncbi:hypothetical protein JFL43_18395 [Viridibacillus sp. YIM B01967]|uniref:Regulatory protein YycH domain-containing protein n=1 Tax=Viridibacillus soli TaxID=2798301 RepID=A0ABS1HBH7_9BACL|nr:two-component system activity regulator YycH [Viridibacillus soli]MBK3496793.1 hypothetical protein [Viridibacillus soli]